MTRSLQLTLVFCLACVTARAGKPAAEADIIPLFDSSTKRQPPTTQHTSDALITRIADRVRDRHAREVGAYAHFLSWYWQERTVAIELVDHVAKGGKDITVNITSLTPLNRPDFRCFFRGINTVAEYHHNVATRQVATHRYTTTIAYNASQRRALKPGDRMEFEFSPFLVAPKNGRKNYYGTATLYIVGRGIVPWYGDGRKLESQPLPRSAWSGGGTTLPYQYSREPRERFKQMAANMAPESAQPFMLGRRLHHTDFGNGAHSDQPNPAFEEQAGKLGPKFVARSCVACHVNNGRALPPLIGAPMHQTVVKIGADAKGSPHPQLGTALQPQARSDKPEATVTITAYTTTHDRFTDGTTYSLQKPVYTFVGPTPEHFSVRLTPPLVGLGLLEAVSESRILALADPDDGDKDGISGRPQTLIDPETGQLRLGRFGYKAGQARLRHQIAGALNSDMGVTTAIFSRLDGETIATRPELAAVDLARMTRYLSTLGVNARRNLADAEALRGERLFTTAHCVKCHTPELTTGPHHPLAELRNQTIRPYTDLLLHDMGPGLADNLNEHAASGAEWRTPPLWSLGLTRGVGGGEAYLHDGRARSLEEAILWHGGEARMASEAFRSMPAADRKAIIRFLKSL
ncbi:MAG: di-heme oxidoredictase family protein [Planctomycetaceae bacterium]|nr:di-heme oxidoredictase family protein [Planctomycetaceae bacterium]